MSVILHRPVADDLAVIVGEMRAWAVDPLRAALHVGDLGWNQQFGPDHLAEELYVWRWDDRLVAVGLGDDDVLRMTVAPDLTDDATLMDAITEDLLTPGRVLGEGEVAVEARFDGPLHDRLLAEGWTYDDPWTPLSRDLAGPVPSYDLRVEKVGEDRVPDRIRVHHGSFNLSTFTAERWTAMTQSPAYSHARSLIGYDEDDHAVAMVTVWTSAPGQAGILEPMGVHHDYRGRGHGRGICLAAAAALQEMGASHAMVSTPSSNLGGIATYVAAGYTEHPQVRDLVRPSAAG